MQAIDRSSSFGPLLKTRPVAKTARLMLHALPTSSETSSGVAIGVLIPKRLAKRAVDRNTLKRLVRHACHAQLADTHGQFLVRLTKPVLAVGHSDRAAWWTEIRQLLSAGLLQINRAQAASKPQLPGQF
ncbi:MAG TPA: ribonuclease P protein component [Limnobacter sp.]|nr:ribonuclease P protein component [Limnobacter sp.]